MNLRSSSSAMPAQGNHPCKLFATAVDEEGEWSELGKMGE